MEQECTCNNTNSKDELEIKLLQEKLNTLKMVNDEYEKYLNDLEEENKKKKAYINIISNENTQ